MANQKLPNAKHVRKLPRWARVAFAARCARRVLTQFVMHWPDAPQIHVDAVRYAIDLAEGAATDAAVDADDANTAEAAADAADAADAALAADVRAAAAAALAAADAAYAAYEADADTIHAVAGAADAADAADAAAPMILADFKTIRELASSEGWTDLTPVPQEVFGPLWPEGPPDGWPVEPSPDTLKLRITVPDHLSDDEALDYVRDLVTKVNALHVAGGGYGLKVDRVTFTEPTPDPVPQPDPDLEPIGGGA